MPGPPSDKEPLAVVSDHFDEQTQVGEFDSTRLKIAKGRDRARYGGEEFCVLCRDATLDSSRALGERLRRMVEPHAFVCDGLGIPITISVGVAAWSDGTDGGEQLILDADAALYDAKRAGRNRVVARLTP
jgi:two-component system cell cycle response regulator